MAKILSMIDFFKKENRQPLDHSLGFHSYPTQTSFRESIAFFKKQSFHIATAFGLWP
jgi:hypothetical protein